jgi:AraC family transcriptional regulator
MVRQLFQWGFEHGVMKEGYTKLLTIYHDNPEITEDNKRRTSIGITAPLGTKADGQVGYMTVSSGKYAVGHFETDGKEAYSRAWAYMFGKWLPESGYLPEDNPPFEVYINDPGTHPEGKQLIDIYVPVKKI